MTIQRMKQGWRLNHEISLPLLLALLIHSGTFIWFIATLNNRVDTFEKQTASYAPNTEKIIKLGADMENLKSSVSEIKDILRNATLSPGKRSEVSVPR